ncbi:hypothetical protein [Hoyosella subflava]|uniref:Uncharacterized protein n=1 Tax=Hoyosella subflava (strain DSM 45089 / JCM 17490 / NBRC 109087 / DQS3-9A1) TaxID=443218 RepID=F6EIG5_HOYSD|nr:hypothetical protein [Hoyosella subflava]AEF42457.1 hypothetical protein AS9A_4023 [Hoyosella subflava DQS3-9A1]
MAENRNSDSHSNGTVSRFSPLLLLTAAGSLMVSVWALADPGGDAGALRTLPWILIALALVIGLVLVLAPVNRRNN